jgi:hypothetical protein
MKKLWQKHRDNIVAVCAIIGTGVAIASLSLKLAELQEDKSRLQVPIKTEIEAKQKPQQELPVQTEAKYLR